MPSSRQQVFVILFDAVLKEDMEYIARAGYELIDHYEEKPRFDFLEIQACFTLFSELDEPNNSKIIQIIMANLYRIYGRSIFPLSAGGSPPRSSGYPCCSGG